MSRQLLNSVHHVAIIVSDYEASRHFYADLLGFEVIRENIRPEQNDIKLDLRCGDAELEIFWKKDAPPRVDRPEARGLRHLAFRVESVPGTVRDLEAMGIVCEPIRPDTYTGKLTTFFRDPDGLPLELHE